MPQKVQNKPSLEEPFEYFDLLYPTLKRDREKIRTKMIGRSPFSIAPYSILDYIFSPKTGKRAPICKTVIVENRYIDKDHSKAVSIFYSRSFRSVPKECVRLHFFSRRLTAPDVSNLEKHNDAYLGFCVLRPLSGRKIGRTVLTRQRYDPTTEFPTCEGTFEVNIGGSKLTIKGSIFMEQDTMVAACASVALWMSTANICRSYGLIECSTSEITTIANEYLC